MTASENKSKDSSSYQSMLSSVEKIVSEISSEELELDLVVKKVEKGYELIKAMRSRLDETKHKIDELRLQYEADEKKSSTETSQ